MKFLTVFILLFCTLPLLANSSYAQILITKTSKQSNLKSIKSKLDRLGVKMYVQKSRTGFFVYSPKYKDSNSASVVLKRLQQYFPSAYILNSKIKVVKEQSTQKFKEIEREVEETSENENLQDSTQGDDESGYFVSLAFGTASMSVTIDESLNATVEDSTMSYALEGGYIYDEDIYFTLGYLNSSTSDADINSLYLSSNYLFKPTDNLGIYTGLLVGYGTLKLNIFTQSIASSSTLLGLQVGTKYNVYENVDVFAGYQLFMQDHIIEIQEDSTTISNVEFGMLHNIQLGVSYKF